MYLCVHVYEAHLRYLCVAHVSELDEGQGWQMQFLSQGKKVRWFISEQGMWWPLSGVCKDTQSSAMLPFSLSPQELGGASIKILCT